MGSYLIPFLKNFLERESMNSLKTVLTALSILNIFPVRSLNSEKCVNQLELGLRSMASDGEFPVAAPPN